MTELNTLICGNSPLDLFDAADINSRGEIVGLAIHRTGGQLRAFLAIPCGNEHVEDEGCREEEDKAAAQGKTGQNPRITVPDSVLKLSSIDGWSSLEGTSNECARFC